VVQTLEIIIIPVVIIIIIPEIIIIILEIDIGTIITVPDLIKIIIKNENLLSNFKEKTMV
jgi:hypothetical protein